VSGNPQSGHYGADYDYLEESPHLRHRHLYEFLNHGISEALAQVRERKPVPEVLEIGAGDGSVTERLLATGCSVTATEMSNDSVVRISERFGDNDRFRAVLDEAGNLAPLKGDRFDLVLFASVLHHIPDYLTAVREAVDDHLRKGGSLVSIQDPLWYPRMRPRDLRISNALFLSWRLGQGNIVRGLKTRTRRAFKGVSEVAPGDTVEYHMVRNGVDELAISELLAERFDRITVEPYWSTQGVTQQKIGERLGLLNTFAIFATGCQGEPSDG
jgi:SAM-dependent methyltransferase